jgi:hypothetical protein
MHAMKTTLAATAVALMLGACATTPRAPSCDQSAYRSLNPAHYDPVKESTRADVPYRFPHG